MLSQDRNTPEKGGVDRELGVAAGEKLYTGALAMLSATGFVEAGATAVGKKGLGRVETGVDNTGGTDGAVTVRVKRGVFRFANSAGGDEITAADIGGTAYIVDDETVAKTDGAATRSPAGIIYDVDATGVWVEF